MDEGTEALKGIRKAASTSDDPKARGTTGVPNYDGIALVVGNPLAANISHICDDLLKPLEET